jgi:hypothetical protein
MKPGYLITMTDGKTALLFDYERAHGIAGHHGWTVRELSPAEAAEHCRAALEKALGAKKAPPRLSLTFTTEGGRKLLGGNLDAVRASGDHPKLERYFDEAGTAELACCTDEREDFERETSRELGSDTLTAEDFASLVNWMADNATLRVHCATTKEAPAH